MEKTNSTSKMTGFVDDDKNTDLHYAAALGDEAEVLELIEEGCDVDPVNYLGWTPLLMATRNGHTKIVQCLIEFRADSTKQNLFGFNILLLAVASGGLAVTTIILKHLLSGGVSKKSLEAILSPISLAVIFQNEDVLEYLIKEEFCANIKSRVGALSPVMIAKTLNNQVALEKLCHRKGHLEEETNRRYLNQNERGPLIQVMHQQLQFGIPSPVFFMPATSPFYSQPPAPMYNLQVPHNPVQIMGGNSKTPANYYHQPANVTPLLSPMFYNGPQMFFPPNFSPSQFVPTQALQYNGLQDFNKIQYIDQTLT